MVESIKGIGGQLPIKDVKDVKEKKAQREGVSPRTDQVVISNEAKARQKEDAAQGPLHIASQALKLQGPLVREDKVSQAAERVQNKYYNSKLSDVAEGVLKDLLG